MAKRIALFNHKSSVSKTTATFNLASMLALKGKRVIMVDTDPQCNLTKLVLGKKEIENFYQNDKNDHIKKSLAPAFEAQPKLIEAINCQTVKDIQGLFLVPSHLNLSEYEVILGIAQELSTSLQTLKNLPGSFSYLFDKTAEKYDADYILIDMNSSLSSINQNLLMTSDYFLVPTSADYISIMALKSLQNILPRWAVWAKKAQSQSILKNASYPFPEIIPKFLGTVIKNNSEQSKPDFQQWMKQIHNLISNTFISALNNHGMVLSQDYLFENFSENDIKEKFFDIADNIIKLTNGTGNSN